MRKTLFLIVVAFTLNACSLAPPLSASPKTYGKYRPINKGIPETPTSLKKEKYLSDEQESE